jgi:hypothetical protein
MMCKVENLVIDFIHILQQQKKEKEFLVFTFLHTIATKQEKSAILKIFSHVVPTKKKEISSLLCSFLYYNNFKKNCVLLVPL